MSPLRRTALALVFLTTLVAPAALAERAQPSAQAVIAFMNIFDPAIVENAEADSSAPSITASSILDMLAADGILAADLATGMKGTLTSDSVSRDLIVFFLADVANGTRDLAARDVVAVESSLNEQLGVTVPDGSGNSLSGRDVTMLVMALLDHADRIVAAMRQSYQSPVM